MPHLAIISSSVRTGRNSNRVATFFRNYILEKKYATVEIIDLNEYRFPIFDERLKYQKQPTPQMLQFADKVIHADGIIIVTPEYNGGYPASIKNAIDLLYDEWHRKPIAISTVSDGAWGGNQVITSLQFSLWKIRAWTVTAMFPVPKVEQTFDENGVPADPAGVHKRADVFIRELLWCVEARKLMNEKET